VHSSPRHLVPRMPTSFRGLVIYSDNNPQLLPAAAISLAPSSPHQLLTLHLSRLPCTAVWVWVHVGSMGARSSLMSSVGARGPTDGQYGCTWSHSWAVWVHVAPLMGSMGARGMGRMGARSPTHCASQNLVCLLLKRLGVPQEQIGVQRCVTKQQQPSASPTESIRQIGRLRV
jgi:hypothetical protein